MKRWAFTAAAVAALVLTSSVRAAEPMPMYAPMGGRVILPVGAEPAPMPKNGGAPVVAPDCCNACESGGITFTFGAYFIRPVWSDNPSHAFSTQSYTQIDQQGTFTRTTRYNDFDFGHEFSPRIQLGYVACDGLGIRAGYQRFHAAAFEQLSGTEDEIVFLTTRFDPSSSSPDLVLHSEARLRVENWELEVTQLVDLHRWQVTVAAGVRYTDVSQSFDGFAFDNGVLIERGTFGHRFNGVGPTVAAESRRPLGNGLALFANARGSLIFGHAKANSFLIFEDEYEGRFITEEFTARNDVLPIGELEIGAEFSRSTSLGNLFIRGGWYGAIYFDAGSSSSEEGNLGFHGLSLQFGISR